MSNRFDYVAYDQIAQDRQKLAKDLVLGLEAFINLLPPSRPVSIALTKLEEVYAWIGKAIRDEQVSQRGAVLQEERNNE